MTASLSASQLARFDQMLVTINIAFGEVVEKFRELRADSDTSPEADFLMLADWLMAGFDSPQLASLLALAIQRATEEKP